MSLLSKRAIFESLEWFATYWPSFIESFSGVALVFIGDGPYPRGELGISSIAGLGLDLLSVPTGWRSYGPWNISTDGIAFLVGLGASRIGPHIRGLAPTAREAYPGDVDVNALNLVLLGARFTL